MAQVLLSLLHSDDPNLPVPLLKALARLAADTDCAKEIRQLGGLNVVISLLSSQGAFSTLQPQVTRRLPRPCSAHGVHLWLRVVPTPAPTARSRGRPSWRSVPSSQRLPSMTRRHCRRACGGRGDGKTTASTEPRVGPLPHACCVLVLQIRKANGVYLLGQLLLKAPRRSPDDPDAEVDGGEAALLIGDASAGLLLRSSTRDNKRDHEDDGIASCGSSHESIAAHAFRTLRFVFSTERNRKLFRRLFPPDLFASFIDVGQYERDLQRRAQPASVSVRPTTLYTNRRSILSRSPGIRRSCASSQRSLQRREQRCKRR